MMFTPEWFEERRARHEKALRVEQFFEAEGLWRILDRLEASIIEQAVESMNTGHLYALQITRNFRAALIKDIRDGKDAAKALEKALRQAEQKEKAAINRRRPDR